MKNLTWQNPEQLFVAQELINKVKSKCCGIKVYKGFLKDCLTFQLYVNDVFGTNDSHIIGKYGKLKETIFDEFSTSKISLTVRYKFNTTRSKYKGTGAGDSQKNRM